MNILAASDQNYYCCYKDSSSKAVSPYRFVIFNKKNKKLSSEESEIFNLSIVEDKYLSINGYFNNIEIMDEFIDKNILVDLRSNKKVKPETLN